jgi:hypothetical protein
MAGKVTFASEVNVVSSEKHRKKTIEYAFFILIGFKCF